MKRLTAPGIRNYIIKNYGVMRHSEFDLLRACRVISNRYGFSPADVFHFIIENQDIEGSYVNSYGFNTAFGRSIKQEFSEVYYNQDQK